jgi:hypothetical protein
MCNLCDENDGEMESCQDCGRLICFDLEHNDDICSRAYVTASGDVFCSWCGKRYDEIDERVLDDEIDCRPEYEQVEDSEG